MLFDVNSGALDLDYVYEDTVSRIRDNDTLFRSLMKNDSFEHQFYSALSRLTEDRFNPSVSLKVVDDIDENMSALLIKEYGRFYGKENKVYERSYLKTLEELKSFFEKRYVYLHDYVLHAAG